MQRQSNPSNHKFKMELEISMDKKQIIAQNRDLNYLETSSQKLRSNNSQKDNEVSAIRYSHNLTSVSNASPNESFADGMKNMINAVVESQFLSKVLFLPQNDEQTSTIATQISSESFRVYTQKIRLLFEEFQKIKNSSSSNAPLIENGNEALGNCYKNIPKDFFDQNYNIENILKNIKKKDDIILTTKKINGYMNEVEGNLCFQITSKFQEFLDIIFSLQELDEKIATAFELLKHRRALKIKYCNLITNPTLKIIKLKQKVVNMKKCLYYLELVNVIHKSLPMLDELIRASGYESASNLFKTAETNFQLKLRDVNALQNVESKFNSAKGTLEKVLIDDFLTMSSNFLLPSFSYKRFLTGEENFSQQAPEKINEITQLDTVDVDIQKQIAKVVLETIKIRSFSPRTLKNTINEKLKVHFKQLEKNFFDHFSVQAEPDFSLEKSDISLYSNLIAIVSSIMKNGINKTAYLVKYIVSSILSYFDQLSSPKSNYLNSIERFNAANLNEIIEEFVGVLEAVSNLCQSKVQDIIDLKKAENLKIPHIKLVQGIYRELQNFFETELLQIVQINDDGTCKRQETVQVLLTCYQKQIQAKITYDKLLSSQKEFERKIIKAFEKKSMELLKQSIECETWKIVEIPPEFLKICQFIFGVQNEFTSEHQNFDSIQERYLIINGSEEYKDGQNQNDGLTKELQKGEIYILKNELFVFNKRYQVTGSFLLVIKFIYDYLHLNLILKFSKVEVFKSLNFFIQNYLKFSKSMTLFAGAKKVKPGRKNYSSNTCSSRFVLEVDDCHQLSPS